MMDIHVKGSRLYVNNRTTGSSPPGYLFDDSNEEKNNINSEVVDQALVCYLVSRAIQWRSTRGTNTEPMRPAVNK